jgi:hypothetical protein
MDSMKQPASDMKGVGVVAAAVAGMTDVDGPVVDATKHAAYNNGTLALMIAAVTAGGQLRFDLYGCDDAAGTNPLLVTSSPVYDAVANDSFILDVMGIPHPFYFVRVKRLTANVAVTGGMMFQWGPNKVPTWSPHGVIPWF